MSTFISYSRADSSFAVRLAKDLKSAGYDVWLDQLDIPTGARWDDEVETALELCTTFMIVLSPESLQSQNVKDEIGYAIDSGKDILPVKIKSGDIPFRLRRFQYVDFSKQPYQDSLKEIKSLLSPTGHLVTNTEIDSKSSRAETKPSMRALPVAPVAVEPSGLKKPDVSGSATLRMPPLRSLLIGTVVVAAVAIAGAIMMTRAADRASEANTPTQTTLVETPTTQPAARPTSDTSQVSEDTQAGPAETFLTTFTESTDLSDWEHFVTGQGRKTKVSVTPANDGLVFNLNDGDLHAYYIYQPVIYEDVAIRMKVENLGQNTNFVSLVCRRTGDTWYEFSIRGDGLWQLYDYNGTYNPIVNGGSQAIKFGKAVNEYEMVCSENQLSLRINGQLVTTAGIQKNMYTQGQVGLSVSSSAIVFPIDMKVIELEVSAQSQVIGAAANRAPSTTSATEDAAPADTAATAAPTGNDQTRVSEKDGMAMIYVPAGEFMMGSDSGEPDEAPAHTVSLAAFWIDETEVTNRMFADFLNSQGTRSDLVTTWIDVDDEDLQVRFVDDAWQALPGYENHPVIEVKWFGAEAYCEWRGEGTRLPTEAEWEKAARGTTGNLYAWGNEIDCSLANYGTCADGTVEVGSYPANASPFGALDMTGNVIEWVADWYAEDYYQNSPAANPTGPDSGEQRVLKGGSWDGHTDHDVRVTARFTEPPDDSLDDGGFRCVLPE